MRKVILLLMVSVFLIACKKEDSKNTETSSQLNQELTAKIISWLDGKTTGLDAIRVVRLNL